MRVPPPDAPLDRLAGIIERMRSVQLERWEGGVHEDVVVDWADELEAVLAALQSDDAAWQQAENDLATCQCRLHAAECEIAALRVPHPRTPEDADEGEE